MLNKKVLLSFLTLGMLAVVASAGTWAYFTTTETTKEETITAGDLKLTIDGATVIPINVDGAYPGQNDITINPPWIFGIMNIGTIPGILSVTCENTDGNELAQYMIINVGGQTVWDRGVANEVVLDNNFKINEWFKPPITYSFPDNGANQNDAMGKDFKFVLKFTLKAPPVV